MQSARLDPTEWKAAVTGRRVRELIAFKIRRQTRSSREAGLAGTFELLPEAVRTDIASQAQAITLLAHTANLWDMDCSDFYEWIEKLVKGKLDNRGLEASDETLFNAFEVICLVLTVQVEDKSQVRKASGIKNPFPLWSAAALGIPILAMASLARSGLVTNSQILGYGVTNLGYVLLAAGLFTGTFGVFRLPKRWSVLAAGAALWFAGVAISNM